MVKKERYSFSKLNAFHGCKLAYKQTYCDFIKGIGNCFSSYGTEVHSIMQRYAEGTLSLWDLVDVYKWEFEANVPEEFPTLPGIKSLKELYYNQGLEFLKNFAGYDDYKILGVEQKFDHDIDDWTFNGIIDLILEDKDGNIIIKDYKSKSSFKSKKEQAEYARQLYLYSLYIKDKYGKFPKKIVFIMFRKGNEVEIEFDERDFNEAIDWAKDTVNEIRNCVDFPYVFEEFFCDNLCNHRLSCEYKEIGRENVCRERKNTKSKGKIRRQKR